MATGTNFQLVFGPGTWGYNSDASRDCDFDKEPGKVTKFQSVSRERVQSLETQTGTNEAKITVLQQTLTYVNVC